MKINRVVCGALSGAISAALLGTLGFVGSAAAATLYVSPTGTAQSGCTTRATPCSLAGAANAAAAGDTVVLADGLYTTALQVKNSGTSSAWITFKADDCATPIIEGKGVGPTDDNQDTGIGSTTAEYIRFVGLVSRGWNTGFGNGWAGGTESSAVSNGHWEVENCISYSNGRTGYTFYSASDFHLKNSFAAHNGSSTAHSWSSGVTLFEAAGTNIIEGNAWFENTDAERRTDGSGFIVDEGSNGATFVNNLAFGNSGSCLRLTKSSGTRFINNTCHRNSQFGSMATGPSNPSELYFTNSGLTIQGVTFMNNVIVGTGQSPAGAQPIVNQPTSGWSNNLVTTGTPTFFTAPTATNPNFVPASGDTMLTGKGGTGTGVPTADIGFNPKCIVKRTAVMVGQVARVSTWQYDVDIDYIKSIGGVAKCFNPGTRTGTPDLGAYRAGTLTTATAGACVGTGGAGGASGSGGSAAGGATAAGGGGGGRGGSSTGGAGGRGGAGGGPAGSGGATASGGSGAGGRTGGNGGATAGTGGAGPTGSGGAAAGTGGAAAGTGGATAGTGGAGPTGSGGALAGTGGAASGGMPGSAGAPSTGSGGQPGSGGSATSTGGAGSGATGNPGGCSCAMAESPHEARTLGALVGLAALGAVLARRRRTRPEST